MTLVLQSHDLQAVGQEKLCCLQEECLSKRFLSLLSSYRKELISIAEKKIILIMDNVIMDNVRVNCSPRLL